MLALMAPRLGESDAFLGLQDVGKTIREIPTSIYSVSSWCAGRLSSAIISERQDEYHGLVQVTNALIRG